MRSLKKGGWENLNPLSNRIPINLMGLHDGVIYGLGQHNLLTSSCSSIWYSAVD
jgi:hypothetical protein